MAAGQEPLSVLLVPPSSLLGVPASRALLLVGPALRPSQSTYIAPRLAYTAGKASLLAGVHESNRDGD